MRRNVSVLLLLCCVSVAPALAAEPADLSGTYTARGVGVTGKAYEATVTLTRRGDTWLIRWQFTDAAFEGVGIRDGDVLSVGWSNHDKAGVVLYTIKPDKLEGRWADGSTNGQVYTETLTRHD